MATSKSAAKAQLSRLETDLQDRIDHCRGEVTATAQWLQEHPEWLQRPDAQFGGHTWEDSLRLAEDHLTEVRRALVIAEGLPDHHPAFYTSPEHIGGSTEFLIKRLLEMETVKS